MKYNITLFFFFFIIFAIPAQDTITYLNEYREKVCCKDSAFFTRMGKYDQGIYDGEIIDYLPSGKIYMVGAYQNWLPAGFYKYYFGNGEKMCTGSYLKHADDEFKILNGWDSLGNKTVKNGNGHFKWHNPYNGKISAEGNYQNGSKEGLWILYNLNGIKIEERMHTTGVDSLLNSWDKTGNKQLIKDGNGEALDYHKNGIVKYQGLYKDGKKEGDWIWYHPEGGIKTKMTYIKGKMNGTNYYYYDNGKLRKEIIFKDGKMNGPVTWYYTDGVVSCKGAYKDDEKSGTYIWYGPTGMEKGHFDY
jgi:antitoxin component YwqK of YwqJK toxin-antitoxin module